MTAITTMKPVEPGPETVLDESLYEVVDGQRLELPPLGAFESNLGGLITIHLGAFSLDRQIGRVIPEMLFLLTRQPRLERRPDVSFVSYATWPRRRPVPRTSAWDVVPDLAIEVISPTNSANEVDGKVRDYFQAGVRRVWVVHPEVEQVFVYSSRTEIRVVDRGGTLEGEPLLPGFRLALADLFEQAEPEAEG